MIDTRWTSLIAQTVYAYSDQEAERAELASLMCESEHYVMAMELFLHGADYEAVRALLKCALIDVLHDERFAMAYCPIPLEYSVL